MASQPAIVFLIHTWQKLDMIFNYATIWEDPLNFARCIARQLHSEIQVCEREKIPHYYILYTEDTMHIKSRRYGEPIDCYRYRLFTPERESIDVLPEHRVFLRALCAVEESLALSYLEGITGGNLLTWEEQEKIMSWYECVPLEFTKRKVGEATRGQLTPELLQSYAGEENKVFVKTRYKQEYLVTDSSVSAVVDRLTLLDMAPDKPLILSEYLNLQKDEKGGLEYRVWVVGHRVSSISRCLYCDIDYDIPEEIQSFAADFTRIHAEKLPPCYVVDLGVDRARGIVVIELNGIISAARYDKNDATGILTDIISFYE